MEGVPTLDENKGASARAGAPGGQAKSDILIVTETLLTARHGSSRPEGNEFPIARAMEQEPNSNSRAEGGPGFLSGVESLTAVQGQNSVQTVAASD